MSVTGMLQQLDVTTVGCYNSWMLQQLDVTTVGCYLIANAS
jgi:hypothetical protein